MTRTFITRVRSRACENFGAVDYTITERLTERDGGLLVEVHSHGMAEGERVDQRASHFAPGVAMESAAAYRLSHGYSEVK